MMAIISTFAFITKCISRLSLSHRPFQASNIPDILARQMYEGTAMMKKSILSDGLIRSFIQRWVVLPSWIYHSCDIETWWELCR